MPTDATTNHVSAPHRRSRYRRQTLVSFGSYILSAVVLIIQIPVLTRTLGAKDYGAWVVSGGVAPLVMILDLGVPYAVNRFVARERLRAPERAMQAITAGLIIVSAIGTVVAVFAILIAPYWADRIDTPAAAFALRIAGIAAAFFLCARLCLSALEGSGAVGTSRVWQSASVTVFTLVSVPTVLLASNKIQALAVVVLVQAVALTAAAAYALRRVWRGRFPAVRPRRRTTAEVLKFGVVASASGLLSAAVEPLGRILLAAVAGPASVAPLDVALRIRGQAFGAASAFLSPVMPALGEVSTSEEVERYSGPIWRMCAPVAVAYGCGMAALAWTVAPYLFGSEVGDDAGPMAAVAILTWIPSSVAVLAFLVVVVFGRARDLAYVYVPAALVSLTAAAALVSSLEAWAIVLATGAGAIVGAVVTVRLARRCLSPSSFRYSAFRGAAMLQATVAGGAVLALAATSLPLGVKVILGALIWLPLSFTLFRDIFLTVREPDQ